MRSRIPRGYPQVARLPVIDFDSDRLRSDLEKVVYLNIFDEQWSAAVRGIIEAHSYSDATPLVLLQDDITLDEYAPWCSAEFGVDAEQVLLNLHTGQKISSLVVVDFAPYLDPESELLHALEAALLAGWPDGCKLVVHAPHNDFEWLRWSTAMLEARG